MIDNDVDKADGELRAMLAEMVNDPVIDAFRVNSDAFASQILESLRSESDLILRQVNTAAGYVKDLPDELDALHSKVNQMSSLLKTAGDAISVEFGGRLDGIESRLGITASTVEALPVQVRQLLADDFADGKRHFDAAVVTLRDTIEIGDRALGKAMQDIVVQLASAAKEREEGRVAWVKASRRLRVQVGLWAVLSILEAAGIAVLLFHAFG